MKTQFFLKRMIERKQALFSMALVSLLVFSGLALFSHALNQTLRSGIDEELMNIAMQSRLVFEEKIKGRFAGLQMLASSMGAGNRDAVMGAIIKQNESLSQYRKLGAISVLGEHLYGDRIGEENLPLLLDTFRGKVNLTYLGQIGPQAEETILISVPVMHENNIRGAVYGILQGKALRNIFDSSYFGEGGFTFCSANTFRSLLFATSESAQNEQIARELMNNPYNLQQLAVLNQKLYYKGKGVEKFVYQGADYLMASLPLLQMPGWYSNSLIPEKNITRVADRVLIFSVICFLFLALLFLLSFWVMGANERKNQREIYRLAYMDELTGLPNWEKLKKEAQQSPVPMMLAIIDTKDFNKLNAIAGRNYGDQLLIRQARLLERLIGDDEYLGRVRDDTFALYLKESKETTFRLERIMEEMSHVSDDFSLQIACGVAGVRPPECLSDDVLGRSFSALRLAKEPDGTNANRCTFYDAGIENTLLIDKQLQNDLPDALLREDLEVWLQPKARLADGAWVGAEALVRWNHPQYGRIAPNRFISLLEKSGQIDRLDHYMLSKVCSLLRRWLDEGKAALPISVNLSRAHLAKETLVQDMLAIIHQHDIPLKLLELELTESAFLEDGKRLMSVMRELSDTGFILSLDDFGSGYSSLTQLLQLPVSTLKIDKGFIDTWEAQHNSVLIAGVVSIAHQLRLKTLAEGVETTEQVEMLKSVGCEYAQGYHYSRPITVAEFEHLVYRKPQA